MFSEQEQTRNKQAKTFEQIPEQGEINLSFSSRKSCDHTNNRIFHDTFEDCIKLRSKLTYSDDDKNIKSNLRDTGRNEYNINNKEQKTNNNPHCLHQKMQEFENEKHMLQEKIGLFIQKDCETQRMVNVLKTENQNCRKAILNFKSSNEKLSDKLDKYLGERKFFIEQSEDQQPTNSNYHPNINVSEHQHEVFNLQCECKNQRKPMKHCDGQMHTRNVVTVQDMKVDLMALLNEIENLQTQLAISKDRETILLQIKEDLEQKLVQNKTIMSKMNLEMLNYKDLEGKCKVFESDIEKLSKDNHEKRHKITELMKTIDQIKSTFVENKTQNEEKIEQLQNEIYKTSHEKEYLKSDVSKLNEEKEYVLQSEKKTLNELLSAQSEVLQLSKENANLNSLCEKLNRECNLAKSEIKNKESIIGEINENVYIFKTKLQTVSSDFENYKKEFDSVKEELENNLRQLKNENDELQEKLASTELCITTLQDDLHNEKTNTENLTFENTKLRYMIDKLNGVNNVSEKEIEALRKKVKNLESDYSCKNTLENQIIQVDKYTETYLDSQESDQKLESLKKLYDDALKEIQQLKIENATLMNTNHDLDNNYKTENDCNQNDTNYEKPSQPEQITLNSAKAFVENVEKDMDYENIPHLLYDQNLFSINEKMNEIIKQNELLTEENKKTNMLFQNFKKELNSLKEENKQLLKEKEFWEYEQSNWKYIKSELTENIALALDDNTLVKDSLLQQESNRKNCYQNINQINSDRTDISEVPTTDLENMKQRITDLKENIKKKENQLQNNTYVNPKNSKAVQSESDNAQCNKGSKGLDSKMLHLSTELNIQTKRKNCLIEENKKLLARLNEIEKNEKEFMLKYKQDKRKFREIKAALEKKLDCVLKENANYKNNICELKSKLCSRKDDFAQDKDPSQKIKQLSTRLEQSDEKVMKLSKRMQRIGKWLSERSDSLNRSTNSVYGCWKVIFQEQDQCNECINKLEKKYDYYNFSEPLEEEMFKLNHEIDKTTVFLDAMKTSFGSEISLPSKANRKRLSIQIIPIENIDSKKAPLETFVGMGDSNFVKTLEDGAKDKKDDTEHCSKLSTPIFETIDRLSKTYAKRFLLPKPIQVEVQKVYLMIDDNFKQIREKREELKNNRNQLDIQIMEEIENIIANLNRIKLKYPSLKSILSKTILEIENLLNNSKSSANLLGQLRSVEQENLMLKYVHDITSHFTLPEDIYDMISFDDGSDSLTELTTDDSELFKTIRKLIATNLFAFWLFLKPKLFCISIMGVFLIIQFLHFYFDDKRSLFYLSSVKKSHNGPHPF